MYDLTFSPEAWEDYLYWQTQDKKTLKRINLLIQSIQRDGLESGLGKPERLRYKDGWSRRIDAQNRLLYMERSGCVYITSFRGHYDD
ncbi:MAG: Txe/YoeB family addiction module toxin [Oscillibacter sp.]|nr:Txe/YoeB family addiction module toxin [Oscillibacter sp.]MBQ7682760.1 Txe/YoeB family addiction module toxin [Oscillibacter sp.]MBQ9618367.1 Txe/YoeB family addiction module toxin [Oscillibacter sp.]